MEYVGEHLWAANLGRGLTALAFTMALLSTVAYYPQRGRLEKTGAYRF
jgi:hypothetical protein